MAQSACINQEQPPWQKHPSLNFSRLPKTHGTSSLPLLEKLRGKQRRWNGYMRHLIGEEEADNLKRADGTPIILPTLSSDEMEWITSNIPVLPRELPQGDLSVWPDFRRSRQFPRLLLSRFRFLRGKQLHEAEYRRTSGQAPSRRTCLLHGKAASREPPTSRKAPSQDPPYFGGSSFTGAAYFRASTFAGTAEKSTFDGSGQLRRKHLRGTRQLREKHLREKGDFKKSTFGNTSASPNTRGKTSFQNVTFKVAPLFFATTLHEDTDWTGITWPDTPADKEDATQYVRRYDRLALVMSTLKQPDNEHRFFRLSMRAKEVRDGWGISTGLSRLYGLFFCYGWGLKRALGLWVFHLVLGAGYLWVMALWQMSQPLPNLTALAISFSNSLPFLGLQRGPVENAYNAFHTLTGFNMLWTIQSLSGPLLLFFLLLTIRNRFRLR